MAAGDDALDLRSVEHDGHPVAAVVRDAFELAGRRWSGSEAP